MTTPTPTDAPAPRARRPATLWVMLVLAGGQGLLLVVIGVVLVAVGGEVDLVSAAEDPGSVALVLGVLMLVLGAVQLLLAVFLARGGHRARAIFGAVVVFQIATGVYSTVALRDFQASGILQLGVSIGVLWLLYGSTSTERFFAHER